MGRRGKRPTPTKLLAARGNPRAAKRLKSGREPASTTAAGGEAPEISDWLAEDDEARACWEEIVPRLAAMGVLARVDRNAIERYCNLWARWRRAEEVLREDGETYEITTGTGGSYVAQRPEVGIVKGLATLLARLEAEFGLTPSARARVNADPSKNAQPAAPAKKKAPSMKIAK